ncbi:MULTISPECIES: hypothetical protein [Rhizobium]|uniref:Uncharacterized protein n=1 Tax=Rhizobium rhododendri TaxID=2506430 RepID=A0ABY8IQZ2_9HYPH|nr:MULTISPECIES: hypothetical protein [Rhizobium]MBO9101163.1 hypothetical protein [Rhizobium sp. L58/93]MBO9170814.1 hypothetical protein [Rhizobium sp. L245/93]MBO9186729.1 hypothetical protein [Rhizobium sp. E27B/91]MBZ5762496.1 hypothetical protein [Rhizobium sp. VS19-DR96]MBZ5768489.1 hypothetical protein [Rhizobium sp. VS19-DR129.2]
MIEPLFCFISMPLHLDHIVDGHTNKDQAFALVKHFEAKIFIDVQAFGDSHVSLQESTRAATAAALQTRSIVNDISRRCQDQSCCCHAGMRCLISLCVRQFSKQLDKS